MVFEIVKRSSTGVGVTSNSTLLRLSVIEAVSKIVQGIETSAFIYEVSRQGQTRVTLEVKGGPRRWMHVLALLSTDNLVLTFFPSFRETSAEGSMLQPIVLSPMVLTYPLSLVLLGCVRSTVPLLRLSVVQC